MFYILIKVEGNFIFIFLSICTFMFIGVLPACLTKTGGQSSGPGVTEVRIAMWC